MRFDDHEILPLFVRKIRQTGIFDGIFYRENFVDVTIVFGLNSSHKLLGFHGLGHHDLRALSASKVSEYK
jgi:hypothetical protein